MDNTQVTWTQKPRTLQKTKWGIAVIIIGVLLVIGAAMGAGDKDTPGYTPGSTPSTTPSITPSETATPSETPSETAEEVKPGELDRVEAQVHCGEAWKKQLALEYEKYKVSEVFGAKATKITSTGKWAVVLPGKVNGAKFTFYCSVGGTDDSPEVELVGMR